MKKIAIMESLAITAEELAEFKKPFEAQGYTFFDYQKTTDVPTLIEEARDAEVMIIANMPMPNEVIRACDNLKFIDVAFTGVDHVGLEACREKGIAVSNASGYANEAVAELAIGMAIDLIRNIPQVEQRCRDGKTKDGLVGFELKGKTVGIIGYGKIGARTGELLHAFGSKILAQSRSYHPEYPDYVEQVSQEELLKRSDIVILHCPLNDSTRGMINADSLAMMKKTAYLINVARGPVVDENALADALNNGVIAGAALDVFTAEPPLDPELPILKAKNTIVTPHIGFASAQSMLLRAQIIGENLQCWIDGKQINVIK